MLGHVAQANSVFFFPNLFQNANAENQVILYLIIDYFLKVMCVKTWSRLK